MSSIVIKGAVTPSNSFFGQPISAVELVLVEDKWKGGDLWNPVFLDYLASNRHNIIKLTLVNKRRVEDIYAIAKRIGPYIKILNIQNCGWSSANCIRPLFPNLQWINIQDGAFDYVPDLIVPSLMGIRLDVTRENTTVDLMPANTDAIITEIPYVVLNISKDVIVSNLFARKCDINSTIKNAPNVLESLTGGMVEELRIFGIVVDPKHDRSKAVVSERRDLVQQLSVVFDKRISEYHISEPSTPATSDVYPTSDITELTVLNNTEKNIPTICSHDFPVLTDIVLDSGNTPWLPLLFYTPSISKVTFKSNKPYEFMAVVPMESRAKYLVFVDQEMDIFPASNLIKYMLKTATHLTLDNSFTQLHELDAFSFFGFGLNVHTIIIRCDYTDVSKMNIFNLLYSAFACTDLTIELPNTNLSEDVIKSISGMKQLISLSITALEFTKSYGMLSTLMNLQKLSLLHTKGTANPIALTTIAVELPVLRTLVTKDEASLTFISQIFESHISNRNPFTEVREVKETAYKANPDTIRFSRIPDVLFVRNDNANGLAIVNNPWYLYRIQSKYTNLVKIVLEPLAMSNELKWTLLKGQVSNVTDPKTGFKPMRYLTEFNDALSKIFNHDREKKTGKIRTLIKNETAAGRHQFCMSKSHNVSHVLNVPSSRSAYVLTAIQGNFDVRVSWANNREQVFTILQGQCICAPHYINATIYLHRRSAPNDEVIVMHTKYPDSKLWNRNAVPDIAVVMAQS